MISEELNSQFKKHFDSKSYKNDSDDFNLIYSITSEEYNNLKTDILIERKNSL
jgi:hypothetical protein